MITIRLTHDGLVWHATCDQDPTVHGWSNQHHRAVAEVRRQLGNPVSYDTISRPTAPCARPGCTPADQAAGEIVEGSHE